MKIDNTKGILYIVPTPIGNIKDITFRSLYILKKVDLIATENIYHTNILLRHYSIKKKLFLIKHYNERKKTKFLIEKLVKEKNIALVSNAGTPLINDPGYCLVQYCYDIGIKVVPLPGPCAAITALSASGLPTNRFCYEGFLPRKKNDRINLLKLLEGESRTMIFYESTHRIIESINDMINIFGSYRHATFAKELTKIWEKIYTSTLEKILNYIKENKNCEKGEIIIIVKGCKDKENKNPTSFLSTLHLLLKELPLSKAVYITSKIYNTKRNFLYNYALKYKNSSI